PVNGFASFVGVLARFRSAVFIRRNQRITRRLCMDWPVVMNTTIREQAAFMREDRNTRKTLGGVRCVDVAFGHAPQAARQPAPVDFDAVAPRACRGGDKERRIHGNRKDGRSLCRERPVFATRRNSTVRRWPLVARGSKAPC